MDFKRGFAPVFIVLAVLLLIAIGGGVYFYSQPHDTALAQLPVYQPTDAAQSQNSTTQTSGNSLHTYTDAKHNFSLQYADGLQQVANADSSIFTLEAKDEQKSQDEQATVAVYVTDANIVGSQCDFGAMNPSIKITTTSINGVAYHRYAFEAPHYGTSDSASVTNYATIQNGFCYVVSETVTATKTDLSAFAQHVSPLLNEVVNSFAITMPAVSEVSVPGMKEYTNPDPGFSFWYPSSCAVATNSSALEIACGSTKTNVEVDLLNNFTGPLSTYDGACQATYSFSASKNQWVEDSPECSIVAKLVASRTMGNLPMLKLSSGNLGSLTGVVVPIGKHALKFTNAEEYRVYETLVNTVMATDASIATPVSSEEQIQIIQSEKDAYASKPTISSLSPASGGVGTRVTFTGSGFTSSGNIVHFGKGCFENVSSTDSTHISITIPYTVKACTDPRSQNTDTQDVLIDSGTTYGVFVSTQNGDSYIVSFTIGAQ